MLPSGGAMALEIAMDTVQITAAWGYAVAAADTGTILFAAMSAGSAGGSNTGGGGSSSQGNPTPPKVDPAEVQAAKDALLADDTDWGAGVLDLSTNQIHIRSASQLSPAGHDTLVQQLGLNRANCRGFVITMNDLGQWIVENMSGLNVGSNPVSATSTSMPNTEFNVIVQALHAAGL
jgi:hypothetical protein